MSAYIPLIRNTRWIDLSTEHKKLREELEKDVMLTSVKSEQLQPIMLQGAFGIGKTNTLYYLFHFGWCELKTPVFYVSLDIITQSIKDYVKDQPSGKIKNSDLGPFINDLLINQIENLKKDDWTNFSNLYFPEFKGGDLNKYLVGFQNVEIIENSNKGTHSFSSNFSKEIIKQAISTSNRPVLLIDEFESKFYELKKYIETSGGGVLRELFDQIVQYPESFFLIIGNGPASGYEIAKEKGEDSFESETAANRRLKTKSIPFPTSGLLKRSFLKDEPKGYINFIWWLSRCRPGHILKLREYLRTFEELNKLSTSEIITKSIFKEPIDEGGESVTYLKTSFFNDIPGKIQATMLNKLLTSFEPQEFQIIDYKLDLKECIPYFYCAEKTINTEIELLSNLREDLFIGHLQKYQEKGLFSSVNYIENIQPYFKYILDGISDEKGNIAFGMINDSKPDEVISETFLNPLLELTYDFISLYQDDSIKETKETLDFLLKIINLVSESIEKGELEIIIPNTFDLFEKCKLLRHEKVYLQLSLYSIRQSIEQPIGSPILKYKNQQLSNKLIEINLKAKIPIIYHKEDNLHFYFIPDLEGDLLEKYISTLEEYLFAKFNEFHTNGDIIIRVLYFSENNLIDKFKDNLLFIKADSSKPEPIATLYKLNIVNLESYQLNFGSQIQDYLDSIIKIGIIGLTNGDIDLGDDIEEEPIIELKKIIEIIDKRPWTDKKETIRTIEHYKKLLLDGDSSVFKLILKNAQNEYDTKLAEIVCNKDEFRRNITEYSYLDEIINDDTKSYDKFTITLALLYLFENKSLDETLSQLLILVKDEYKFEVQKEIPERSLNFRNLFAILTNNHKALNTFKEEFDLNSKFISSLFTLSNLLNNENEITKLVEYFMYLEKSIESNFFNSYHSALGGYSSSKLTTSIYDLSYLRSLDYDLNKKQLSEYFTKLESDFLEIRTSIVETIEDLKSLLDDSNNLSSYVEKLNKAILGIGLIKRILKEKDSLPTYLILLSIFKHFEIVRNNSKTFLNQLDIVLEKISDQKIIVDKIQEEIDLMYKDSLTNKLLDIVYPNPHNNEYLWEKIFFRKNLKNKDEYDTLFELSYNPFTKSTIESHNIDNFNNLLLEVYEKTNPVFNNLLEKTKEININAENTKKMGSFLEQLLNSEN